MTSIDTTKPLEVINDATGERVAVTLKRIGVPGLKGGIIVRRPDRDFHDLFHPSGVSSPESNWRLRNRKADEKLNDPFEVKLARLNSENDQLRTRNAELEQASDHYAGLYAERVGQLNIANTELAELRAWKAAAVEKHPELDVDPDKDVADLLAANHIVWETKVDYEAAQSLALAAIRRGRELERERG